MSDDEFTTSAVLDALDEPSVVIAVDGSIVSMNAAAAALCDRPRGVFVGRPFDVLDAEPLRFALRAAHRSLTDATFVPPRTFVGPRGDGKQVLFSLHIRRVEERGASALLVRCVEVLDHGTFRVDASELVAHSPDYIFEIRVTEDGRFIQEAINRSGQIAVGRSGHEVVGKELGEFMPSDAARVLEAHYRSCVERGEATDFETVLDFGAGRRSYHAFLVPFRDERGRIVRLAGFGRDTTERRRAEAALRESERRFAAAFRSMPYSISVSELATGRYVDCNDAFERVSGYRRDEVIGKTSFDLNLWLDPEDRRELVRRMTEDGTVRDLEIRFRAKGGRIVIALCHCDVIEVGGVPCLLNTFEDVSERLRVNAELRASEEARRTAAEEFRLVFESSPLGLALLDASGRPIRSNPSFQAFFGRTPDELLTRTLADLEHPDEAAVDRASFEALLAGRTAEVRGEKRFLRADGSTTWGTLTLSSTHGTNEGQSFVLCVIEDANERRNAEQALRESQDLVATAFRASPNEMSILDFETSRYLEINDAHSEVYGFPREEVIGRTPTEVGELADPADAKRLLGFLRTVGKFNDVQVIARRKDGTTITVARSAELVRIGGRVCILRVSRDVTATLQAEAQRAQLEAQLRQAQKLEALGTLAGGIAHDFNNILTASLNFTDLAIAQANDPRAVRELLTHVNLANSRAQDLVRQILAFSRRQQQERRPTSLVDVVAEALRLLESSIPKLVRFETYLAADAPRVLADATQIHQVVMNLCTNAAHAIGNGTGTIVVRVERARASEMATQGPDRTRPYARLLVSDDGTGIDPETLRKIFDPFFTTKGPGEGTGLGLSVVHGIVTDHDGTIEVESKVGVGTTFRVYLPEHTSEVVAKAGRELEMPKGNGEHVLLVDDEVAIADASRLGLERLGFRVTTENDPTEALRRFTESPSAFDVVVSDFAMPHITGLDLARSVLALRPDIPVILMSGYSDIWNTETIRSLGLRELLNKPVSFSTLARSIRRAIDVE